MDYFFGSSGAAAVGTKRLRCRIGPSLDCMAVAKVNDENNPHFIDSPFFTGYVGVRVKNFKGFTPDGSEPIETLKYFEGKKRLFSVQVQGRFKHEYTADDVVFGSAFEHKVTPPTGSWVALKFAALIDPALKNDIYDDKPWLWSPALCSYNIVNVSKPSKPVANAHPSKQIDKSSVTESYVGPDTSKPKDKLLERSYPTGSAAAAAAAPPGDGSASLNEILGAWEWKGETELSEDSALLFAGQDKAPFPADGISERRKYFQKEPTRKKMILKPDYVYNVEMFAPFIDLNTFDLNLGININLLQYLNKHPLRLISKSLSKDIPFFIIEFALVESEDEEDDEEEEDSGSGGDATSPTSA
ncbi:hypothetical protein HDU89_001375 [Geranomyces variabilis]|nr:hypothetical protein HDU89_001375 [Geranomyces variabilis]